MNLKMKTLRSYEVLKVVDCTLCMSIEIFAKLNDMLLNGWSWALYFQF